MRKRRAVQLIPAILQIGTLTGTVFIGYTSMLACEGHDSSKR